MIRSILVVGFVLAIALLLAIPFIPGHDPRVDNILLNLGTELAGIVITVALVDLLLERQKRADAAKQIAWRALHELDHAVWVWQGGSRALDIGELRSLIQAISIDSPLPDFTETLLLRIGSGAENTLRLQHQVVKSHPTLRLGLEKLAQLAALRDGHSVLSNQQIADILEAAVLELERVVGITEAAADIALPSVRPDARVEAQERRHYGRRRAPEMPANPATPADV